MNGKNDTVVLLATYNGERYIEELLSSLGDQEFKDFDVVVSDDGSTDDTGRIIADCKICPDIPLHITRYFPRFKMQKKATDIPLLFELKQIAETHLKHVIVGNV